MPIKFACEHCGQVLSVSSTKAGKGAKCPKCHQGITVPTPETAAVALARRKQASAIVTAPAKEPKPEQRVQITKVDLEAASRPPLAPVEVEPPKGVRPEQIPNVAGAPLAADPKAEAVPVTAGSSAPPPLVESPPLAIPEPDKFPVVESVPPVFAPTRPPEDISDPFAQFVVYDDGAELVYAADTNDAYDRDAGVDRDALAVPRRVLYMQGVLLAVVALVCFVLGVLVGSATNSGGNAGPRVARPCQVSGSVVFRDRRKEASPDDGAVVILLPQDARPDEKAEVLGLRPDDPTPDSEHPALAAIRSLGGDYARADSQGRFKLRVSDSGPYYVLFISRNTKRKTGETFKTADLAQLGRYFSDAAGLIGESRYRWKVERIQGDRLLSEEFN
jgi:phage FluMu protein Com